MFSVGGNIAPLKVYLFYYLNIINDYHDDASNAFIIDPYFHFR